MIQENKNSVRSLPQHDIEKIARATAGIEAIGITETTSTQPEHIDTARFNKFGKRLAAVALVGGLALGFAPRGEQEAPAPEPKSLIELAQDAAHIPVNVETDTLIANVVVNAKNPTPGEAVFNNPAVKAYTAENPDELTSLETSTYSLPFSESGKYAVVERDIDKDGDSDAVAVPAEEK